MSEIVAWFTTSCSFWEWPIKAVLVLDGIFWIIWAGFFPWFFSLGSTTPGMNAVFVAHAMLGIGHMGTPNTMLQALNKLVARKMRWLRMWWLAISLIMDVYAAICAFSILQHAASGRPPEMVLKGMHAISVLFVASSLLSLVSYIAAKISQGPVYEKCANGDAGVPLMGAGGDASAVMYRRRGAVH